MALYLTGNTSNITIDSTSGITFPNSTLQASAGSVLQVVYGSFNTQVTLSSASYANIGLSATITPKFATSKVLVMCAVLMGQSTASAGGGIQLLRGGSVVFLAGPADSNGPYTIYSQANGNYSNVPLNYLDSPATTSATTYYIQARPYLAAGPLLINGNVGYVTSGTSTMLLMEVAA